MVEPPRIRDDGFHGGRCEPVKLIYDFKSKGLKGKYIDVVSLYPTVMYYDRYPVGHPARISKPDKYNTNWFGFIYCKILPPRGLYLPVLPYKQKIQQATKLLFGLCRACMSRTGAKCSHFNTIKGTIKCNDRCATKACQECKFARKIAKQNCQECYNERNADCTHTDSERAITGLWTTTEMEKYIRKFLKIKLETSEFTCSEEEYRRKAREFGIELGELKRNPGMRFIAKICLNSLCGK